MIRLTPTQIFVFELAMVVPATSKAIMLPEAGAQPPACLQALSVDKYFDGNAQEARSFQNGRIVGSERVDGEGSSQTLKGRNCSTNRLDTSKKPCR